MLNNCRLEGLLLTARTLREDKHKVGRNSSSSGIEVVVGGGGAAMFFFQAWAIISTTPLLEAIYII